MVTDHSVLATDPDGGATEMTRHGGSSGPMAAQPQEETTIVQVYNQKIGKMNVSFQGRETAVLGDNNTINITKSEMDDEKGAILEDIQQKVSNIEKDVNRMVSQPKTPMSNGSQTNVPARKEFNMKPEKQKKGDKEVSAERKHAEGSAEATIAKCIDDSDDVLVTRSRAEQAVVQCLKNYNMVFITGVTGEGKTTLAAKIMKDLRDGKLDETFAPKTPVRVFIPEDWTKVVDNEEDIVVFVDDVFGTSNYQVDLLNRWKPVFKAVEQALEKKKVLLLLTSRTHILADARRDAGITDDTNDHILSEKKSGGYYTQIPADV
ncbi:uncharacterized protein [Argopecten irradians]|uniref:uncharacterized protein n=1 Tax=Argopecten irradians TaxID=31199 RepID=UPI003723FB20